MAPNQSSDGSSVSSTYSTSHCVSKLESTANLKCDRVPQAIDSLRKLEIDAEALRREAHHMGQAELLRNQHALQRRLALVSSSSAFAVPVGPCANATDM